MSSEDKNHPLYVSQVSGVCPQTTALGFTAVWRGSRTLQSDGRHSWASEHRVGLV